jgi:hypothetical protein
MLALCRGILAVGRALSAIDPEIVCYAVDATDLYEAGDPDLADIAAFRQAVVFLALDLLTGRVDRSHPLWSWLLAHGAGEDALTAFGEAPAVVPVIGLNVYPMFSGKRLVRGPAGRLRMTMPYTGPEIVARLGRLYHARYGRPLAIAETASLGSVRRRREWLAGSVAAVATLRTEAVPVLGYTWWPLFSLVTWSYRQGNRPVAAHLAPMGLFDLDERLDRHATAVAEDYRRLAGDPRSMGPLGRPAQSP